MEGDGRKGGAEPQHEVQTGGRGGGGGAVPKYVVGKEAWLKA